jgi:hypothetical protein
MSQFEDIKDSSPSSKTVIPPLLASLAYRVSVKKISRSHRDQVIVIWKFERENLMNETMYDVSMCCTPHLTCAANWTTGFVITSQRSFCELCTTMLAQGALFLRSRSRTVSRRQARWRKKFTWQDGSQLTWICTTGRG